MPDSFFQTSLEATDFCVDSTVRRAAALGFDVTVAGDAHTTGDKPNFSAVAVREHHNTTLRNLMSFPGKVQTVAADSIWA